DEHRRLSENGAAAPARRPAGIAPLELPEGALSEPQVKALLASYGIPAPREFLAGSTDEAAAAARDIGFPVALKAVSRAVVHKSAIGAVKLGLADEPALRRAWDEIAGAVRRHAGNDALEGCLVSAMVRGEAELIVGLKRDPQFGAIVLVGF